MVDDDADEVELGLGFDLMGAVFEDADDSVILALDLDLVIRRLLDEVVDMAGDDEASAAALATAALVTLRVDIFANITVRIAVNMAAAHQHNCARHGYHFNETP